jgi:hypothetical protein
MIYKELKELYNLNSQIIDDSKHINRKLKKKMYVIITKCMVIELNRGTPVDTADCVLPTLTIVDGKAVDLEITDVEDEQ